MSPIRAATSIDTVTAVTLRDDVRSLLAADGGREPDASGLGDLPAELVGTVLGHFADTAPIDEATALSPVVMATSAVPFDPRLDGVGTITDPLGEVAAIEIVDRDPVGDDGGLDDTDPGWLDGVDAAGEHDVSDVGPLVDDADAPGAEDWGADGSSFGAGADRTGDPADEFAPVDEATSLHSGVDGAADVVDVEELVDPVADLDATPVVHPDSFEIGLDDVDPMDDGFDDMDIVE